MEGFWYQVGTVAAIVLPLWNIPLIFRIVKRKTSDDISLSWVLGVWSCIVLMLPSSIKSPEFQLKAFAISNIVFFTGVLVVVLKYRNHKPD